MVITAGSGVMLPSVVLAGNFYYIDSMLGFIWVHMHVIFI